MLRQSLAVAALVLLIVLFPLAADATPSHGSPREPFAGLAIATATPTATASPFPTVTPTTTPVPIPTRHPDLPALATPTPVRPFPFIPLQVAPARDSTLNGVGPLALHWGLPAGTTQYQVQVLPGNGDGPGLNLIRGAEAGYTIPAPVLGEGPYILLPGMRYIWRVRATDKADIAPEDDRAWGPWSEFWSVLTPRPSSAGLTPVTPVDRSTLATGGAQLVWRNYDPAIFYFEIQVSGDTRFDPNPLTATSFVWWNLVHSGVTDPPNSWRTPPLQAGGTYFWRVRPRVQGDGTPVAWGPVWRFTTTSALTSPTPTPTPSQTPQPGARIAFLSYRDGAADLYTMNSDGGGVTRLTKDGNILGQAVWSADARRLAYVTSSDLNREVHVIDADGRNPRNLTRNTATDDQPSWAANGARLVWVSTRDGNPELYTMFADGTGFSRLTTTGAPETQPVWSPDNAYIAFVSQRDGNREIYVVAANGGEAFRLTLHDAADE